MISDSPPLRNRSHIPGGQPPPAKMKITSGSTTSRPSRRHNSCCNSGSAWRDRRSIVRAAVASLPLIILFRSIRYFKPSFRNVARNVHNGDGVISLEPIDTLSTVPLGFSLDLPKKLLGSSIEIYLDSRLISSIHGDGGGGGGRERKLNFGTCDVGDRGENPLKHSFTLGRGELEKMTSVFLEPGGHLVEIHRRRKGDDLLTPYAKFAVTSHSPPELTVGGGPSLSSILFWRRSSPYEDAYNLALREVGKNIACDHFVAGAGWSQLWTRDTSYAAELGGALLHPEATRRSLESSVEEYEYDGRKLVWLQDNCGHFGGWPNLSDAIVGVRGAWSLYLVTGDKEMLSWAYDVTKNSLERAERDVFEHQSGLFRGCSSFLESNSGYPEKYKFDGGLVGKTKALSTNMLYYSGYKLAAKMGTELGLAGEPIQELEDKARLLKASIQRRLWSPSNNNYAYFEDENGMLVETAEGLGISLALLDFEDDERNDMILESTHTTEHGVACLWPPFNYSADVWEWKISNHYHNGRLWPFVQGYWAMAAAQHKHMALLADALKSLTTLSQRGNTFAEYYELNATFPQERRSQLWSATGYLSMFYHGIFGIRLEPDGIRFSPMKPIDMFDDTIHLKNLRYRGMVLNIHLVGSGTTIKSFELNHEKKSDAFIKSNEVGIIDVDISLK